MSASFSGFGVPVIRLTIPCSSIRARNLKMPAIASFIAAAMTLSRKNRNDSPTTTSRITQSMTTPSSERFVDSTDFPGGD